ncbi:MAG: HNH endonuclease family protein [Lachnospiraceae bacterium]|nr:HNH endonuclease family protein [Lachnospiraceae bacterium]
MRYLQPIEKRDDAKKIWEEIESSLGKDQKTFLRYYAIHKYNYNTDKKQGISVYKSIQKATKGRNVNLLLNDLRLKSQLYYKIVFPSEVNKLEYEIFTFFKKNRVEQFRPLIMSLMHQKMLEKLSTELYEEILKYLYKFFVCYKIIGEENSNKLSDTIYKYSYLIEIEYSDSKIKECINALNEKLPTLDSFINTFKNIGWSNHWGIYKDSRSKERCQLILEILEKYVANREINIPVTIEHILPDSERIENAQIGNLLYLEENLNQQCADKTLERKMDIYEKSSLTSPIGFAKRYRNKSFNPDDRTVFLARLIYNNILDINL